MLKSENMMGIASDLKGLEEKQLMQMAKSPDTSSAPPFLVIAELQRRKRDKAMNTGPAPTTTVKDDTLAAAAGVPQGGISGLARAMNPQMAQPGQMPTMKMAEGSRGPIPPRPTGANMRSAQEWWDQMYGGPPTANPNLPAYLRNPTPEGAPRLPSRDQFPSRAVTRSRAPQGSADPTGGAAPFAMSPMAPPSVGGSPRVPARDQFPSNARAGGMSPPVPRGPQVGPQPSMSAGAAPSGSPLLPGTDQFPNRYNPGAQPKVFDLTKAQPTNPEVPSLGYGDTSSLPAWKQPGRSEDATQPKGWMEEMLGAGQITDTLQGADRSPMAPPMALPEYQGAKPNVLQQRLTENAEAELADDRGFKDRVADFWDNMWSGEDWIGMGYGSDEGSTEAEKAQPEPLSEEEQEEVKTRIKETLLGGGGGAGGGVGGAAVPKSDKLSDLEAALRKEKWMALARFGFALMSSDKPTMGQAMGDAGMYMMDALQAAQDRYQQLKATEEELMLRRMAAASRGKGAGGGSAFDKVAMREEYQNWRDVAYQIRQSMVGMEKGDKGYDKLYNELTFAQNKANEARMMLSMIGAMPPTDLAGGMPGGGNYDARTAG